MIKGYRVENGDNGNERNIRLLGTTWDNLGQLGRPVRIKKQTPPTFRDERGRLGQF
jgi:hypothetical protein